MQKFKIVKFVDFMRENFVQEDLFIAIAEKDLGKISQTEKDSIIANIRKHPQSKINNEEIILAWKTQEDKKYVTFSQSISLLIKSNLDYLDFASNDITINDI